jgi:tetratricopeptide (TPR) repeat protein
VNRSLFVVFGILVATAQPAWAEDQAAIEANARFQEGKAFQKQGKNEDARIKYLQALSLTSHEKALYNLANIEFSMGHFADSMKYARAYVKHPKADAAGIADMKKHYVEALAPKTGHAAVTAPSGAAVTIDGALVGTAPLSEVVDVMPGTHVFGAMGRTTEVTFAAGEAKNVTLEQPVAAAVTTAPAVSVVTPPVTTPPSSPVQGAETEDRSTLSYVIPGALVGLGVAGVTIGAVFASSSNTTTRDGEALLERGACRSLTAPSCQPAQDKVDSSRSQSRLSTVMYVGGGLLVAGGAAAFFFWPHRTLHVAPTVGGVTLLGTF